MLSLFIISMEELKTTILKGVLQERLKEAVFLTVTGRLFLVEMVISPRQSLVTQILFMLNLNKDILIELI